MITALAIIAAVVVIGLLLWQVMSANKDKVPGGKPLDNQGRPTNEKKLDPAARHNDALGNAIGDTVASLYKLASEW